MSRDKVLAICLDLPAAEETYPFGDEVAVIKVGGRMFALVPLFGEPGSVNLKSDPAQALELRRRTQGSDPATTRTSATGHRGLRRLGRGRRRARLDRDSYHLVVTGLPRSIRPKINPDERVISRIPPGGLCTKLCRCRW